MPMRRQTLAEARLKGDQAERDHLRRYGAGATAADLAPGDLRGRAPPSWADKPMREAFRRIVEAAPVGLLRSIDYDLVTALAEAITRLELAARAQRRGRRVASSKPGPNQTPLDPAALWRLTRDVREAGADILRYATALGLPPLQRSRLSVPAAPSAPELPDNPHLRSVTLVEAGKVRGVYRVGRRV
jgi:hypothetical protein